MCQTLRMLLKRLREMKARMRSARAAVRVNQSIFFFKALRARQLFDICKAIQNWNGGPSARSVHSGLFGAVS